MMLPGASRLNEAARKVRDYEAALIEDAIREQRDFKMGGVI